MSDSKSIAAVTKTLCHVLSDVLANTLTSPPKVMPRRPDSNASDDPTLFVHLYRVAPNVSHRNDDLPTRASGGTVGRRPRFAGDLYYLLSFRGDDETFVPQRMLGAVVAHLHTRPLLMRDAIAKAIASSSPLEDCDLASEPEPIRLTPIDLSLDDLTKMWSTLAQTPQLLSIAYQASVVGIDGALEPRAAAPVREVVVHALPHDPLPIQSVSSTVVFHGDIVRVVGPGIGRPGLQLGFAQLDAETLWTRATPTDADGLKARAPDELDAGWTRIHVAPISADGAPARPSSPERFGTVCIAPTILRRKQEAARLVVTLDTSVRPSQVIVLRGEGVVFPAKPRDEKAKTLEFAVNESRAISDYTIEVDGVPVRQSGPKS